MKTMTYNGFTAQVVYSKEDRLHVGDVLDIGNDVVCFHGSSDEELEEAFKGVVDLYVESKQNKSHPCTAAVNSNRKLAKLRHVVHTLI